MLLHFTKMHGLGNDFVIIDARLKPVKLDEQRVRALADRHTGVGCDQVITIEPARNGSADVFMRIHNSDGMEVAACGNGARCVASIIASESGQRTVWIETLAGNLEADIQDARTITIDMGVPELHWSRIPLAKEQDTLRLDVTSGLLRNPAAVNMGNPHAVAFVETPVEDVPLHEIGPQVEHLPMFPERVNFEVANVIDRGTVQARVWERGSGLTMACGTGACAVAAIGRVRGITDDEVGVSLPGGELVIRWPGTGQLMLEGPVEKVFEGEWPD